MNAGKAYIGANIVIASVDMLEFTLEISLVDVLAFLAVKSKVET